MEKRPDFNKIKSYEEFSQYYWYREELKQICKNLGIDHSGSKLELNQTIEQYFLGNLIKQKKSIYSKKTNIEILTLDTSLVECGFVFSQRFRDFFSQQTGIMNFKFNADMVATAKKVKQENDVSFTLQDMLDLYYGKKTFEKFDSSSCEWNKFLKDFCTDEASSVFKNKLKSASVLWKIVRNSTVPKVYSNALLIKHWDLLNE